MPREPHESPEPQGKHHNMGWANCGKDSEGRPIGYAHGATCDQEGCNTKIDRGLAFACGSMHGSDEVSCEKYFCEAHKTNYVMDSAHGTTVCNSCAKALIESGEWEEDEEEGAIVRKD